MATLYILLSGCIVPYYGTRKISPHTTGISIIDADTKNEIPEALLISRIDGDDGLYLNNAFVHSTGDCIDVPIKKHWYMLIYPICMMGPFEEFDGFVVYAKGYQVSYYYKYFVAEDIELHKATDNTSKESLRTDIKNDLITHPQTIEGGRIYGVSNSVPIVNRLTPSDRDLVLKYLSE